MAIKHLHVTLAAVSITLFLFRGIWHLKSHPWLEKKLTKILPHIVDTLLLLAGVYLATRMGAFSQHWLWLKLVLIVGYIATGVIALKSAPDTLQSKLFFAGAVLLFGLVVAVAVHRPI